MQTPPGMIHTLLISTNFNALDFFNVCSPNTQRCVDQFGKLFFLSRGHIFQGILTKFICITDISTYHIVSLASADLGALDVPVSTSWEI